MTANSQPAARPERPFATVNPYTGETVKTFPFLSSEEVPAVIERADRAYREWSVRPVQERAAAVRRAGELMLERTEELAALITLEMGKLLREARGEVALAASILKYYGEQGPTFLEPRTIPVPQGEAAVLHAPTGVLLGIEPWNYPLYQVVRFAAPNLVVGNTVLLKHSELCPQSALALQQLFGDAGVPQGVYNNVFLRISDVEQVIAHPAVQGVSLTGSERAGASVAELAGRHLKKCVLELGGSDPFIVLDTGDLDTTVQAAAVGRLSNTGQACIAAKRLIVVDDLYDDFVAKLGATFSAMQPGDPADPATQVGPLSSEQAARDLQAQVQDAIDKGATVVAGGQRPEHPGAFLLPTILTDVTPDMRAYREELFGPVAVVYRVKDEDEAVQLANSSVYGLGGAVFSSDTERAQRVADRLETGMVWINHPTSSSPELPFGGVKRSGFGRELSSMGMLEFTNQKLVRVFPVEKKPSQVVG
ncbi:NAD-dependent succinate-semialdehyde dehydrogenase [Deinococcus sp. Marseille-Q6407]|uniref:NAD-dependent succinate-semialdehyde dehydrogenase n=1 Tax=Deinococcus sp. Marseille-Q6407 TaxID=2969223 RepID=UPI0021C17741|nr:NAD-dependent succinate-semialdehyde dehydrogenase [Deinococcus sp. Marseille-Q6407]